MSPLPNNLHIFNILLYFLTVLLLFRNTHSLDPLLDSRCLECIRNVSTSLGTDVSKRCEGYYCGQFQISYTYWAEAGKPSNNRSAGNYERCARDRNCAEQTVRAYFNKFKRDCNNDGVIDCLDMAALHRSGPTSCSSEPFKETKSSEKLDSTSVQRTLKNQTLSTECLDCICEAVTGCNANPSKCGNGGVCGPFAISQTYWKEGKRPGASWTSCARTRECSSVTVKNYMEKYKRDCNDDGFITCEDYAAIHRRGHRACNNKDLYRDPYWVKFSTCRANQKPENDVNMVKVNEGSSDELSSGLTIETTSQLPRTSNTSQTIFTAPPPRQSINKPTDNFILDSRGRPETILRPQNSYSQESNDNVKLIENTLQPSNSQQDTFISTTSTTTTSPTSTIPPAIIKSIAPTIEDGHYPTQDQFQNQNPEYSMSSSESPQNGHPQPAPNNQAPHLIESPDMDAFSWLATGTRRSQQSERPTNFDKTVLDIVGQPDFVKPYPPSAATDSIEPEKPLEESPESATDSRLSQFFPNQQIPQNQVNQNQPPVMDAPIKVVVDQKPLASIPITAPDTSASVQPALVHQRSTVAHTQSEKLPEDTLSIVDADNLANIYEKSINETGRIANECLECICDASSNCDTTVQCISKQREKNRCGLYMISYNQFVESDISLLSMKPLTTRSRDEGEHEKMYRECTTDKTCAERLIHLYIEKYQRDCNNDGKIDCYDIAAIHRVGPDNCNSDKFLSSQYWRDFNICYTTDRLTTTVQP